MGLPSGTFSSPSSGLLDVTFSGEFYSQSGGDWGAVGGRYIAFLCRVLQAGVEVGGGYVKTGSPSCSLLLAYPGGNVAWTIDMSVAGYSLSGPSAVGATNLRIACALIKR